jgi:acetylornithine deacetylase/succinyl-diaminopimelate desuccinylase-like protein
VPNQKPDMIAEMVSNYLRSLCPDSVNLEVVYDHGGAPFYADSNSPFTQAALLALHEVFGHPAVLTREGLSIPIVSLLQSALKKDPLLIGLGLVDCNAHAPNETFPLEQFEKGIQLHQTLLDRFSSIK